MALIAVASGVVLLILAALLFQRSLVYFPERLPGAPPTGAGPGPRVVPLRSPDGPLVYGLYAPPPDERALVALVLHGNAGNLRTWSPALDAWADRGFGALLLDPRGYGWSEGSPSEQGLVADAEAAVAWLQGQGIGPERLVVHGVSIGGGVALHVATAHPLRALLLESPFTSLAAAAQHHYPFLPCRLLLLDRYDNLAAAPSVSCPVLVLHGSDDEIVPVAQGRRLAEAFTPPARFVVAEGWHHNDLSSWPGYESAIHDFLRLLR